MISQGQQTMTVHSSLIAFIKCKFSTAAFLLILRAYTVLVDRTGDWCYHSAITCLYKYRVYHLLWILIRTFQSGRTYSVFTAVFLWLHYISWNFLMPSF